MNHLRPRQVRVFTPEGSCSVVVPLEDIEKQQYSEEDLDLYGNLNLSLKGFKEFIHIHLKGKKS